MRPWEETLGQAPQAWGTRNKVPLRALSVVESDFRLKAVLGMGLVSKQIQFHGVKGFHVDENQYF